MRSSDVADADTLDCEKRRLGVATFEALVDALAHEVADPYCSEYRRPRGTNVTVYGARWQAAYDAAYDELYRRLDAAAHPDVAKAIAAAEHAARLAVIDVDRARWQERPIHLQITRVGGRSRGIPRPRARGRRRRAAARSGSRGSPGREPDPDGSSGALTRRPRRPGQVIARRLPGRVRAFKRRTGALA